MFKAVIVSRERVLYEGEADRIFLPGSHGEFEVLELHKSIVALLKEGFIVVDGDLRIRISKGLVRMVKDELVAVVEE